MHDYEIDAPQRAPSFCDLAAGHILRGMGRHDMLARSRVTFDFIGLRRQRDYYAKRTRAAGGRFHPVIDQSVRFQKYAVGPQGVKRLGTKQQRKEKIVGVQFVQQQLQVPCYRGAADHRLSTVAQARDQLLLAVCRTERHDFIGSESVQRTHVENIDTVADHCSHFWHDVIARRLSDSDECGAHCHGVRVAGWRCLD
jgi:hypothetical protein